MNEENFFEKIKEGDIETVKNMIDEGIDIRAESYSDWMPIHYAVAYGQKEIIELLLSKGVGIEEKVNGKTPLMVASASSSSGLETVEFLVSKGADVHAVSDGQLITSLMEASYNGNKDIAEFLISQGVDVNAEALGGRTALMSAAYGHSDIIEVLLSNGAEIDIATDDGQTALGIACNYLYEDCIKLLVKNGANPNKRINYAIQTPLMYVSKKGSVEMVKLLLSAGADVNAIDARNTTALMEAIYGRQLDNFKLLYEHGADIEAKNRNGENILEIATDFRRNDIVEFLTEQGINK